MGEKVYVKTTEGVVPWLLGVISNDRPSVLQSGDGEWKTAIKTTFGGGLLKLGSPVRMKITLLSQISEADAGVSPRNPDRHDPDATDLTLTGSATSTFPLGLIRTIQHHHHLPAQLTSVTTPQTATLQP